ncbi:MAG: protein phosphatase 2C domain-containing protein [Nocardiopsaceae bacterium]|nr:protein phosphatase 2C domain-containing protein [Nocardiopsaceae bacterium]
MTAACPSCGETITDTDGFCEACGAELAPAVDSAGTEKDQAECPVCAADESVTSAVTAEGFCEHCGRKVPIGRDHVELDIGPVAGVSDRGLRHSRNEDAMAMASAARPDGDGPVTVAVVCDGVSSAPRANEASLAGARAAIRVLLKGARTGEDHQELSVSAAHAAGRALAPLAGPAGNPAATYTAAIITPEEVTVSWLGDSRVYWLSADTPSKSQCLTTDDSLAEEVVAAGLATMEQAMEMPQAHVITRWLGADMPDPDPHVARFTPPGPGAIMLCSDGLWNYRPGAADLAGMTMPAARAEPLAAAVELTKFAVESGGVDNITVVIVPFPPARTET